MWLDVQPLLQEILNWIQIWTLTRPFRHGSDLTEIIWSQLWLYVCFCELHHHDNGAFHSSQITFSTCLLCSLNTLWKTATFSWISSHLRSQSPASQPSSYLWQSWWKRTCNRAGRRKNMPAGPPGPRTRRSCRRLHSCWRHSGGVHCPG